MAKGYVNTPGRIGYNLAQVAAKAEDTLKKLEDVAAACLTLGSSAMADNMLDGTFNYDEVIAPAFAIGSEDIAAEMLAGGFDFDRIVGEPATAGSVAAKISN